MPDCPTCGLPVKEGERFCNACGSKLPKLVKQVFCPVCGNTVFEDAVKCNLCGTKLNNKEESTSAAEVIAQQQEAMKNPSMDELFVPVITDEMLGLNEAPIPKEELPTMDSVQMPGQKKQEPQEQQKVSHRNDPLPMPTIIGNDGNVTNPGAVVPEPAVSQPASTPTVNIQKTPQVAPTPTVNNTYQQPVNQYQQQPDNPYQQYGGQQNNNQYQQQYAQQGGSPYQQYGQQPDTSYDSQATTVLNPSMINNNYGQQNGYGQGAQQQNPYMQNNAQQNPYPQSNGNVQQNTSKPKKGGLSMVQIILIVAIVVVILVDVFVLFKDKIFGGGDKEKNSAAVVSVVDFDDVN